MWVLVPGLSDVGTVVPSSLSDIRGVLIFFFSSTTRTSWFAVIVPDEELAGSSEASKAMAAVCVVSGLILLASTAVTEGIRFTAGGWAFKELALSNCEWVAGEAETNGGLVRESVELGISEGSVKFCGCCCC